MLKFYSLKSAIWTKQIVLFLLALCTFVSCSESVVEEPDVQKSRVNVTFSGFQFEVTEAGKMSRAGEALSTAATRLSFAVYNASGSLVETIHQESGSNTFGTIQMDLYPGTYQLVAVAHNGSADAVVSSATSVTLPGTTFTDTFAKVQSLTVESGKDCSFSMTLVRLTSAFILRINDTPPANAKEIQVVVNSGGIEPESLKISPTSGLAENTWKQIRTIPIKDFTDRNDIPVYFIGMFATETWPVTVLATAYDTDGNEIISHTISSVPLKANQKTVAIGNFFNPKASGELTLETEWGTNNEFDY